MSRGYRLALCAAFGLLIAASQPNGGIRPEQSRQANQEETAAEIKSAGNAITAAINEAGKPAEKDWGCEERDEKRHSDLCAQWKAADAADRAANWAAISVYIGVVGAGLLIWTFWDSRITSRRQLRAYMAVEYIGFRGLDAVDPYLEFTVAAKNNGQTPAYDFQSFYSCKIVPLDAPRPELIDKDTLAKTAHYIVGASSKNTLQWRVCKTKSAERAAFARGKAKVEVVGAYRYTDIFGRTYRFDMIQQSQANSPLELEAILQKETVIRLSLKERWQRWRTT
jgi:hypothetical protein